jgi:hypothetical protein
MPLPKPTEAELRENDRSEFVGRCVARLTQDGEFSDNDTEEQNRNQRVAVCSQAWRDAKK